MRPTHPTRTTTLILVLSLAMGLLWTLGRPETSALPGPQPPGDPLASPIPTNRRETRPQRPVLLELSLPPAPESSYRHPSAADLVQDVARCGRQAGQPRPAVPTPDPATNTGQLLETLVGLDATAQLGSARCFIHFQHLVSSLREQPGACRTIEPLLADPDVSTALRGLLLESLALANTDPARQILHQFLLEPGQNPSSKSATLQALIAVERPHPDTLQALGRFLEETRESELALSTLNTLGQLAGRLDPSDHQLSGWVAEIFETYLADDRDPTTKLKVLEILGASRSPLLQDALFEAASSEDPVLRETALTSLARHATPQSSQLLAEKLRTDPSESIRALAAGALGHHQAPGAEQILLGALANEAHKGVRLALLDALAPFLDRPAVKTRIEQVARKTSDPDLKHLARRLLEISSVGSNLRG